MVAFIHIFLGAVLILLGLYNMGVSLFSAFCFAVSYHLLAYGIDYLMRDTLRK